MIEKGKDVLIRVELDEVCDLVLCKWKNQFVTWIYNKTVAGDGCGCGKYFPDTPEGLKDAVEDFQSRFERLKR